jgi:hypothetical protein
MLQLKSLQLQLKSLKVLFSDAMANEKVSIDDLRKIREQIKEVEMRIEERKTFLFGGSTNN